jgi:hypothetical protein
MANAPLYQNLAQLDTWQLRLFSGKEIDLTTTETTQYTRRGLIWVETDPVRYDTHVHLGRIGDYVRFLGSPWITPDGIEMRILSTPYLYHLEPMTDIYKVYLSKLQESPELSICWVASDPSAGWESYIKHRVASDTLGCSC